MNITDVTMAWTPADEYTLGNIKTYADEMTVGSNSSYTLAGTYAGVIAVVPLATANRIVVPVDNGSGHVYTASTTGITVVPAGTKIPVFVYVMR